jgi:hypothetical protein
VSFRHQIIRRLKKNILQLDETGQKKASCTGYFSDKRIPHNLTASSLAIDNLSSHFIDLTCIVNHQTLDACIGRCLAAN